jgi:hypothetical protein
LLVVPRRKLSGFLSRAEAVKQPVWVIGQVKEGAGIDVI